MTDIWSAEKRSEVMSRIRGSDTKPELLVRSMLHRLGYRFTVRGPKNKSLPGRPDLVLPKHRVVVFVHGCFWHGHDCARGARAPKQNREYWVAKVGRNVARDAKSAQALTEQGWRVETIWECELKDGLEARLQRLLSPPTSRVGGEEV